MKLKMAKPRHTYKTTDKLYFGQYKGETVSSIMKKDAQYIKWLAQKGTQFSKEIKGRLGI